MTMTYKKVLYDHRSLPHVINYRAQNSTQVGDRAFIKGELLQVDTCRVPAVGDAVVIGGKVSTFRENTIKITVMGVIIRTEVDDE
jgi:hypothetical protein